jgi:hypothetical protein
VVCSFAQLQTGKGVDSGCEALQTCSTFLIQFRLLKKRVTRQLEAATAVARPHDSSRPGTSGASHHTALAAHAQSAIFNGGGTQRAKRFVERGRTHVRRSISPSTTAGHALTRQRPATSRRGGCLPDAVAACQPHCRLIQEGVQEQRLKPESGLSERPESRG